MPDMNIEMHKRMANASFLTLEEIHRLINSSADTKVDIAKNIAKYYKQGSYEENQIKIAEQIFRTLLKDTEIQVRKALSESIKDTDGIPYDVVVSLARDIEEVSLPVLQFSEVLSDADLIDIISTTENEQQHIAITNRKKVPEKVVDALINTKKESVVGNLVKNKGALVSEEGFKKIVDNHGGSEVVLTSMVERGSLPVTIVERITSTISDELYRKLSEKHKDAMVHLEGAMKKGRDVATMQVMGLKTTDEEFRDFTGLMRRLKISEELIPISALCMANMNLFEVSVARRIKVPVLNIRQLLKDHSNQGFRAIYGRASIPMHLYEASVLLFEVVRELGPDELQRAGSLKLSPKSVNRLIEKLMLKAEERGDKGLLKFSCISPLQSHALYLPVLRQGLSRNM
jgi:uncharacterized protein (DUF2336 family)